MNNLIIIPARKNAVRLKNKNILKLHNKTLIEHTITFAKKICPNTHILVSTDSKKIREKVELVRGRKGEIQLDRLHQKHLQTILYYLNYEKTKNSLVDFKLCINSQTSS